MNEKPRDNLRLIKGIGPVWQKRLRKTLGVRTVQDLATLSSDEIVTRLKPAPTKSECETWIRQAQELMAAAKSSTEVEETGKRMNSPADPADWKPVASFVVEFLSRAGEGESEQQTKVQHMETDTNASWPGIANLALCRWMLEQMGETDIPQLEGQIEEIRFQAQSELEQVLEEQEAAARQELEQMLEAERVHARQALQKDIDAERTQAQRKLEQELDATRTQAQQELEKLLEAERARTRLALQKELTEEFAQARNDLEQELDERRHQAQLELKQALEKERADVLKAIEEEPQPLIEASEIEIDLRPEVEEGAHPMTQPSESRLVHKPHSALAITSLRVFQPIDVTEPVGTGIPGRPFSGQIKSRESFTFVVEFELAEPVRNEMIQQGMTYQAQFYVRDLLTGGKEHLGNTMANSLIAGRSSYIARLTNVTLERSVYELTVLVTVQNSQPRADYLMVPFLQVD